MIPVPGPIFVSSSLSKTILNQFRKIARARKNLQTYVRAKSKTWKAEEEEEEEEGRVKKRIEEGFERALLKAESFWCMQTIRMNKTVHTYIKRGTVRQKETVKDQKSMIHHL